MDEDKLVTNILVDGYRRAYKNRADNRIHVSNLKSFCPREFALCNKHDILYNYRPNTRFGEIITFAIGDMIHESITSILEQEKVLIVKEVKLANTDYGFLITGSCDALIKAQGYPKYIPLEFKSMNGDRFDALEEPTLNDARQLSLYLWLMEKELTELANGNKRKLKVDTETGVIVYFCKLYRSMPIKSYIVKRNENFIKAVEEQLKEVKTFSKQKKMPKRICADAYTMMAKRPCRAVSVCFKK